ncbi:MAG TPA: outer membrane beta-barrel protein [Candidatus Acidoferrum sp.]|nr:outer membrane beta-barrel protein [Candidatus Acidoferrum sp.]
MKKAIAPTLEIRIFLLLIAFACRPLALVAQTPLGDGPTASTTLTDQYPATKTTAADPAGEVTKTNKDSGGFFSRFGKAYWKDWTGTASVEADQPRRGYPAPISSPPFPFSDWPYGGSPVIGAPDTAGGPLMTAIYGGKHGEWWESSRVKIYGWVNSGFNFSTSTAHYGNAPASYYIQPNSIQLDQFALYIERAPDTVQKDHFDWGFRVTQLYGLDYRFTTAKGYFSNQLLKYNNGYGYDPVMAYVDLYFGQVADGMNIRIGRYISLPDIEAQLAPDNYTYSHSLLYTFDAYTQTGINITTKLNNHWLLQVGLSAGNDVAPWVGEPDAKPTFNACVGYSWRNGWDNVYTCDNSTNSGKYAYNNLQAYYTTWYHKFNSSWHMDTETWYMWEKNVPNVNSPAAASLLITNANGAVCNTLTEITCYAPEWAIVNYVAKEFSTKDYLSIRNEYMDDSRGQRTGFRTRYTENMIGWGHWFGTTVLIRPELRYEHAYDAPAYNDGTKKSQFVFASDLIWHF